jgi:hypothetical protein
MTTTGIVAVYNSVIIPSAQQIILSEGTWAHILEDHSIFGVPIFEEAPEKQLPYRLQRYIKVELTTALWYLLMRIRQICMETSSVSL